MERFILKDSGHEVAFEGDPSQLAGNLTGEAWLSMTGECQGLVVAVETVAGIAATRSLSPAEREYAGRVRDARSTALDGRPASERFSDLAQVRQQVVDSTVQATVAGFDEALAGWLTIKPHRPGLRSVSDINTAISLDTLRAVGSSRYVEYAKAAFKRFELKEWSELRLSSLPSHYSTEAIAWVMSGLADLDDFIVSPLYETAVNKLTHNAVEGGWGSSWPTKYNDANTIHTSLVVSALSQYDNPTLSELAAGGVDWLRRHAIGGVWGPSDPLLKVAWSSLAATALHEAKASADPDSIEPLIHLLRDKIATDPLSWPQRIFYNSEAQSEARLFTHFIGASRGMTLLSLGVSPLDADVLACVRRILEERYRDGTWRLGGYPSPFYARGAVLLLLQWLDRLAHLACQLGVKTINLRLGDPTREAGEIDGRMTLPLDQGLEPAPKPGALAVGLTREPTPPHGLTDLLSRSMNLPTVWSASTAHYRDYSSCASSMAWFADWLLDVRTREGQTYLEHVVNLELAGLDDTDSVLAAVAITTLLYAYGSYSVAAADAIATVGSDKPSLLGETVGPPSAGASDIVSATAAIWANADLDPQTRTLALRDWAMAGTDDAIRLCALDDKQRAWVSHVRLSPGIASAAELALNLKGMSARGLARLTPVLKTLLLIDSPDYAPDFDDDPLTVVLGLALALTGPSVRNVSNIEGGPLRPYFEMVVSLNGREPSAPAMLTRDLTIEFRKTDDAPTTRQFNADAFRIRVEQELRRFRGGPLIGVPRVAIKGVGEPEVVWTRRCDEIDEIIVQWASQEVFRFSLAPNCTNYELFAFHLLSGLISHECFCESGKEPRSILPLEDVRAEILAEVHIKFSSTPEQAGFRALEQRISGSELTRFVALRRRKDTRGSGTTQAYWLELREDVKCRIGA